MYVAGHIFRYISENIINNYIQIYIFRISRVWVIYSNITNMQIFKKNMQMRSCDKYANYAYVALKALKLNLPTLPHILQ